MNLCKINYSDFYRKMNWLEKNDLVEVFLFNQELLIRVIYKILQIIIIKKFRLKKEMKETYKNIINF